MKIAAAGNTEVPAYLSLIELGFEITVDRASEREELWKASNGELEILGNGPLELLALVKLFECRGEDWKAKDVEIDRFVNKYYPSTS